MIGALTTFAHDFFITPSDSKTIFFFIFRSDKIAFVTLFAPLSSPMRKINSQGGRFQSPLSFLSRHSDHEHSLCDYRGLRQRKPKNLHKTLGAVQLHFLVLYLCRGRRGARWLGHESFGCGQNSSINSRT